MRGICVLLLVVCASTAPLPDAYLQDQRLIRWFGSGPSPTPEWQPLPGVSAVRRTAAVGSNTTAAAFLMLEADRLHLLDARSATLQRIDTVIGATIRTETVLAANGRCCFAVLDSSVVVKCTVQENGITCSHANLSGIDFTPTVVAFDPLDANTLFVGALSGLFRVTLLPGNKTLVSRLGTNITGPVTAIATAEAGNLAVSTPAKLWLSRGDPSNASWYYFWNLRFESPVTGLSFDDRGQLWLSTEGLAHKIGPDLVHTRVSGKEGLPTLELLGVATSPGCSLYFAASRGAVRLDLQDDTLEQRLGISPWKYFLGPRWLPVVDFSESQPLAVTSVSVLRDAQGTETALLVSLNGLALLRRQPWSLAAKAANYQAMMQQHDLFGQVTECELQSFGDTASCKQGVGESTGLWTGIYVAAAAFRYAAAPGKDPALKSEAWRRFLSLELLVNVTGVPGLPARAARPIGYGLGSRSTSTRLGGPKWRNSTAMPGWEWMNDTSSDEIAGHMLAYPVVYDLVAETEAERKRVANLMCTILGYIARNGFYLVDATGVRTTWGVWAPEKLNDDSLFYDERGLNSLQMLTYLIAATRICSDESQFFYASFTQLVELHGYALNTINQKITEPDDNNFSDDELAFLPYFTYIWSGLNDPLLDKPFRLSIDRAFGLVRQGRSSLWNAIYSAYNKGGVDVDDILMASIWTLQVWPESQIDWPVNNTGRSDVIISPDLTRSNTQQSQALLPYDEISFFRWNANPFELTPSGSGLSQYDPGAWLLPYWMLRFYKLVE